MDFHRKVVDLGMSDMGIAMHVECTWGRVITFMKRMRPSLVFDSSPVVG